MADCRWPKAFLIQFLIILLASCGGGSGGIGAVSCGFPGLGGPTPGFQTIFTSSETVEAVARITVSCDECAWDKTGSEAVVLAITLNDRAPQHLPIVRGGRHEYQVLLGSLDGGRHTVGIDEDANLTAPALRGKFAAMIEQVMIDQIAISDPTYAAISRAPIVYARENTVGHFTDVPILMWYETEPSPRGTRYRYTVIFTNEDGGTPADRLMATWGRTTDIEYIYSVEVDGSAAVLDEDMQGPEHKILRFNGKREGRHPLLWVSTENNMVLDQGPTSVRYAPAPMAADLRDMSREAIMDAQPWTYEVMARELIREGKVVADAPPGNGVIPDPRRYAYFEGCGTLGGLALTVAVQIDRQWISSDRGVPEYRIARDGCFRGAIPLPANAKADDMSSVRVQAFERKDKPGAAAVTFTRLNTLFTLDDRYAPGRSLANWTGTAMLVPGGPPFEIAVR